MPVTAAATSEDARFEAFGAVCGDAGLAAVVAAVGDGPDVAALLALHHLLGELHACVERQRAARAADGRAEHVGVGEQDLGRHALGVEHLLAGELALSDLLRANHDKRALVREFQEVQV